MNKSLWVLSLHVYIFGFWRIVSSQHFTLRGVTAPVLTMIKITNDSDINLGRIFCNDKDLENSDKECVLISGFTEAKGKRFK